MSTFDVELLKSYLNGYLSKKLPGILSFLNLLCTLMHKSDCITLLFTSPSKLYLIMLSHYRGDVVSADYAFTLIFLSPIAGYLNKPDIVKELLNYAKTGRDSDFIDMIKRNFIRGMSA